MAKKKKRATKKQINEFLDDVAYFDSGMRKINGGYADFDIKEIQRRTLKKGNEKLKVIRVFGCIVSGIQDCGDGHSEEQRDEETCYLTDEDGKLRYLTDGEMYAFDPEGYVWD